jgi:hypothetical protein
MEVIKPSKTLAERIGNWSTEADFSQVAEVLDVADSIAEAFRDRNLDSTPPQLDVVIRPESKWQDVDSHYHSANLVLLLLLPFLIPQTHFMLHLSIVPFYTLNRVVNPRFIHLIFLFAPPPTNLIGVPALSYWHHHLHLAASTYIEPVPLCWSTCECTWLVVPPLC